MKDRVLSERQQNQQKQYAPDSVAVSDPEIGCSFQNVPAKTDLRDTFRGGHPEKIAIQLSELQQQIQISTHN